MSLNYYFRYSAANIQQDFESKKKNNKKVLKSGRTEYMWYYCINKVL